jgi:hypothetical protein
MSPRKLALLIGGVTIAAGLTILALTLLGVPPGYILLGTMAASVAAHFWSRRT